MLIGIHTSDIYNKLNKLKEERIKLVQTFVDINKPFKHYDKLKSFLKSNNIKCVIHASYTINLASNWDSYSWFIKQLILEIEYAHYLGAFGIVVHLGKQLKLSESQCLNNMYSAFLYVHNQTKEFKKVKILIETSTGQGSELCYELDKLAHFYRKISLHPNKSISNRFGICLDTCHIWAAGYNIKDIQNIEIYFDKFNELIGIKEIKLIHLNDSKNDLGSKLDRHENIGKGYIGLDGLIIIAQMFSQINVPIVLETPFNEYKNYNDLNLILNKL